MQLLISTSLISLGKAAAVRILSLEYFTLCVCVKAGLLDIRMFSWQTFTAELEEHGMFLHLLSSYVCVYVLSFSPSGLYYVDSEGNRVCGDLFAVGSGSMYAYGVMDSGLRQDLSVDEACELGRRAIYQATYRDAYSGGQVNLYHVHSEGWTRVSQEDVLMLHQKYKDQA